MDDIKKLNTPSAYNGPKPQGAIPDIFIQDSFSKDDERLWVPLAPGRWSRPLCFNISQGYWVHLTKVIGGGFCLDTGIQPQFMDLSSKGLGDTSNMIGLLLKDHIYLNHQVKFILS